MNTEATTLTISTTTIPLASSSFRRITRDGRSVGHLITDSLGFWLEVRGRLAYGPYPTEAAAVASIHEHHWVF
jgi:hypothetical protein